MPQRESKGILFVLADCKDLAREQEFNDWYDSTHLLDVLSTGPYFAAKRFVNTNPEAGPNKYLAIYDTDWDDPRAAMKELGRAFKRMSEEGQGRGRIHKALKPGFVGAFKRIYPEKEQREG